MHMHCRLIVRTPLADLDGTYLEFTPKPGVLRCIRPEESYRNAQGLYFICPKCRGTPKSHGVTLLFKMDSVPPKAKPEGRWTVPSIQPLSNLSLNEKVFSPTDCGMEAHIANGKVRWK